MLRVKRLIGRCSSIRFRVSRSHHVLMLCLFLISKKAYSYLTFFIPIYLYYVEHNFE